MTQQAPQPERNSRADSGRTLVIILIGLAILVFAAFIVITLAQGTNNVGVAVSTEEAQAATEESTAEAQETSEVTDSATSEAESTESVGGGEESDGAPTPTSRSRVRDSIQIGTQVTPALQSTAPAPGSGESDGEPTPTSRSRVRGSILIGSGAPTQAAGESAAEATESAEATAESTAEATEQAEGGATMGRDSQSSGGGNGSRVAALPTAIPGRPQDAPSALQPSGPVAARQASLLWFMVIVGTIIYITVLVMVARILAQRFREPSPLTPRQSTLLIAGGGVVLPTVVIVILFALTLGSLSAFAISTTPTDITIEVTGYRWWWHIRYPGYDLITANEIHIPVGQPVQFVLQSSDVIHSFWVPELGGKMDLIPGRTNRFWLQADQPGEYRGLCAEYCGTAHAHMGFLVIADTPEDFQAWVENQLQPPAEPANDLIAQGQAAFARCAACHAIRGTDAQGVTGPDLSHLASRRTLGAASVPNTAGYLAGWIINPQGIKPGALMPPQQVSGQELQALLAYLGSLE